MSSLHYHSSSSEPLLSRLCPPSDEEESRKENPTLLWNSLLSLILSYLINHASPILSNKLSNTSVWMLWNSSLFNLLHFIIVWSCGHYYKVWHLLGITPHCWLNAKPLLHTAYTQTLFLFSQTIFLHSYFLICSFFHTLSFYLFIFLSLTYLIAGSYLIGGYLDYILLNDKPELV